MGEWIEKEQRGKMDAGRMAKRSVSIEEMGNCFPFLFLVPSIPLYVWGGRGGEACLSRERGEILVDPKKHLTKRKVHV